MSASRLYFDASNVLSWGAQPMVGIPRVESVLVREALKSGHNVFLFDRKLSLPRLLSAEELPLLLRLLAELGSPGWSQSNQLPFRKRWTEVRRLAALSEGAAGPELERHLASMVAGDWRRQGTTYQASKLLVRTYFKLGRSRPGRSTLPPEPSRFLDDPGNHVWLSTRTTHDLTYAGLAIQAKVYAILHDLIPPDYAPS